jgi:3-hydroxyacyl-[acyl-carrier-protein] dehydratase
VAQRVIRHDDPIFEDHFPGSPVYPGVLLIEMMAQAASLIIRIAAYKESGVTRYAPGAIGKVKSVSFLQPVRPGDILAVSAERGVRFGRLSEFHCAIARETTRLVSGTLVLSESSPTS